MPTLVQRPDGAFTSRKVLPKDVRAEYGRLYGARYEAKFFTPATTGKREATRLWGEWLAEVLGRISNIRAERDGTGRTLTARQARALAGDWYQWWTERHAGGDRLDCERQLNKVQEAIWAAVSSTDAETFDPDELWESFPNVRDAVRPVLADVGETSQFLAAKQMALTNASRDLFLDYLYEDLSVALHRLIRLTQGDYSPDTYPQRFPRGPIEGSDSGSTPWELFEAWVSEREPATGTVESWRYVFNTMVAHFEKRSATSIMPEEAAAWIKGLINEERHAHTVKKTWLNASNTVFRWAVANKHVARNPFADVKITVPRKKQLRETKAFHPSEAHTILRASTAIKNTRTPDGAAKRWVPWLCAYTGARVGEITQLRGSDVIERDGIHGLRITPDAGTVKNRKARAVPLHEHIVAQGFLAFVEEAGRGPLFYRERKKSAAKAASTKQKKSPGAQTRQRLAEWVRELGVDDLELSPNHAWRHTFKQIAERAEISERMSDAITGHAHKSEGAKYGAPTLEDMARALKKFPRYMV